MNNFNTSQVFRPLGGASLTPPTFARTGTAYLDGVSYAANTPRFPNTAGTVGVLVEEATANLIGLTNGRLTTFNTVAGTTPPTATLITDPTNPHGTESWKVVFPAGATTGFAGCRVNSNSWTLVASTKYSETVWIKGDTSKLTIRHNGVGPLTAMTATGKTIGDWAEYRAQDTSQASGGAMNLYINLASATASDIEIYVGAASVEAKAYATTEPFATRNAETLTVPTAGILRPDRGTVIVRTWIEGDVLNASGAAQHRLIETDNGSATGRLMIYGSLGNLRALLRNSGGTTTDAAWATSGTVPAGYHGLGYRWSASRLSLYSDGAEKVASAVAGVPASLGSVMYIGCGNTGLNPWNYPIAYVAFYDRALSDAEMTAATTGNLPAGYTALLDFRGGVLRTTGPGGNFYYGDQVFQPLYQAPNQF